MSRFIRLGSQGLASAWNLYQRVSPRTKSVLSESQLFSLGQKRRGSLQTCCVQALYL